MAWKDLWLTSGACEPSGTRRLLWLCGPVIGSWTWAGVTLRKLCCADSFSREKHEMVKVLAAMEALFGEVHIQLGTLRQPQVGTAPLELHRTVVHADVLGEQANLGNGPHQISFQVNDLEVVGPNPCPALQTHWIVISIHDVGLQANGLLVKLPEVHQPGRLTTPIAETFAVHLEVIAEMWVEGNRQDRQAGGRYLVRHIQVSRIAVFLNGQRAGCGFADGRNVIELTGLAVAGSSSRRKVLVNHMLNR